MSGINVNRHELSRGSIIQKLILGRKCYKRIKLMLISFDFCDEISPIQRANHSHPSLWCHSWEWNNELQYLTLNQFFLWSPDASVGWGGANISGSHSESRLINKALVMLVTPDGLLLEGSCGGLENGMVLWKLVKSVTDFYHRQKLLEYNRI